MIRIAIRADGDSGAEAGLGHVFRSLAYVEELVRQEPAVQPYFLMRDFPEGIARVSREGHSIVRLPPRPSAQDYHAALASIRPDLVIVDTLGSTPELIAACREFAGKIVTLDDLTPSALSADVIVNGILWATAAVSAPPGGPKVYQGVEYLQLRKQFAAANRLQRTIAPEVREIVISTGGADIRGFAAELAHAASYLSFPCHVNVMVGPAYGALDALNRVAATSHGNTRFTLVENATNMADYLMQADVALLTGGTVMFESLACGTPTVVVSSYEHQLPQSAWFGERGLIVDLGYFPGQPDHCRIASAINVLSHDLPRRQEVSRLGKETVDGCGLDRFVDIVRCELSHA